MTAKLTLKRLCYREFDLDTTTPLGNRSSTVYPSNTDHQVAAKKIVCDNDEKKRHMQKQIDLLSSLLHPNMVEVIGYDIVEVDETVTIWYLFMERAKSTLKEFMTNPENADFFKNRDNFMMFMLQMIKAGEYLENMGIGHGDICPENILLFDNYLYKLAGTEFAKQTVSRKSVRTGSGCKMYKAPEVAKTKKNLYANIDLHRCDIYAMGIVLLEVAGVSCDELGRLRAMRNEVRRAQRFHDLLAQLPETFAENITSSQLFMMVQPKPKNRSCCSTILGNWRHSALPKKCRLRYYQITSALFEKYALLEDSTAQCSLGAMYKNGRGMEKSYEKAVHWYQKAANQGNASAQNNLGMMYYSGKGVEESSEKAVQWWQKAADQENTIAQNNLGLMYCDGKGVEESSEKAVQWFRKAADQGNTAAQFNLGARVFNGEGIGQSSKKAVQWFRKAADQGDINAQRALGGMYYYGVEVEKSYDKASQWFQNLCRKMGERPHEVTRRQLTLNKELLIEVMPRLRIIWELSIKMRKELSKAARKQTSRTKNRLIKEMQMAR